MSSVFGRAKRIIDAVVFTDGGDGRVYADKEEVDWHIEAFRWLARMSRAMNEELFILKNRQTAVEMAIEVLNSALEADPEAMQVLMNFRVRCNQKLADHPTIQVGFHGDGHLPEEEYDVGLMGIINGLFGTNEHGAGHIAMSVDAVENHPGKITHIEKFQSTQPKENAGG